MSQICPTITAYTQEEYRHQMELVSSFAKRIHIDLMDGHFAKPPSISIDDIWWPEGMIVDIHVMYEHPENYLDKLIALNPHMVIVHAEAKTDIGELSLKLRQSGIRSGLALLQGTPMSNCLHLLPNFRHLLIFSGHLGHHGGQADLKLLSKVAEAKLATKFILEIGWDGGVNDQNIQKLLGSGVQVLNVGSFIHSAQDPKGAYDSLVNSIS